LPLIRDWHPGNHPKSSPYTYVKRPINDMAPHSVAGGKNKVIIKEGIHGLLCYTIYQFLTAFTAV